MRHPKDKTVELIAIIIVYWRRQSDAKKDRKRVILRGEPEGVCVCMQISHLECTLWLESCDNREWLVSNACYRSQLYRNMHGHQRVPLDALSALFDYYCTKSNDQAERIAIYQGICIKNDWSVVSFINFNRIYV